MPGLYLGPGGPEQLPPPGPQPRTNANPGPGHRGGYSGGNRGSSQSHPSPPPAPPPDIFAGYTGPAVDAASQIARQFVGLMGYPSGLDVNQLALQLLHNNLLADPTSALSYLFENGAGTTDDMRRAHPGAQFGLDGAQFQQKKEVMDATFMSLVNQDPSYFFSGGTDLMQLYKQAFKNNWSQQQILQTLQNDPKYADLLKAEPWLASGQGYQQASQTFSSIYGSAPVDTATLASWFRFNTGATQLSRTGREAITSAASLPSASEAR